MDERSATVAKEALHNYKIDGENKIKVCVLSCLGVELMVFSRLPTHANDTLSFSLYVRCFFAISNLVDGIIAPRSLAYLLELSALPSTLEYEQIL